MGIFDFLRKITENRKTKETEKEKIALSEIGNFIENRRKEIELREGKIFVLIQDRINALVNELKRKINIVKNINVGQKKAEDRLKSAVEEGRKKYVESVEFLINNLNNLQEDKLENIIADIDKTFLDFNKRSHMSYERATILIGKEMEDIKNELKVFSKEIINVFDENKELVDSSKSISLIKSRLKLFGEIKTELEKINELITSLSKEIADKEEENKLIIEEIEEIKKSSEYLEYLEKQRKIKLLEDELKKDFLDLGQLIDFKALGNFYHIFEDTMEVVKSHRDHLQTNFQRDNGKNILNLLNESKLNNENILDKIAQITRKKEEIPENEKSMDKTRELYSKTTKIITEIGNLKNKKSREEKKYEMLKAGEEEIANKIMEGYASLN